MKSQYSISIYLDTRRSKDSNKYPVRLRVYANNLRKQKLYSTKFDFTEDEFDSIWKTTKPREKYRKDRLALQALESRANKIADELKYFSFAQFEKRLYRKPGTGTLVTYHYEQAIKELIKNKQISTANTYSLSRKSLKVFCEYSTLKIDFKTLSLYDITPKWLEEYEKYMIGTLEKSTTTVSIYVRVLRAIYNLAIAEGEINNDTYPFGKRKYQIPSAKKVKKALNLEELAKLYHAEPKTKEEEKAKDFWLLSYACQGINLKDIALIKESDFEGDTIHFYRAKTRKTTKSDQKPITVYLNDFSKGVIDKYKVATEKPADLIFPIIEKEQTPEDQQRAIKNFTRYINQHIKKLAKTAGITNQISYQWARHSYATNALRKGASMEFIQEALGHDNLKTTQNYIAGFDDETKKKFAKGIMNFD